MEDLLPHGVFAKIREQFATARPLTAADYAESREDEDVITGAMAKGLREAVDGTNGEYTWRTVINKTRGRGNRALEKQTGADVVIEIEVLDQRGDVVGQKGLLAQAKNGWARRDRRLVQQVQEMERLAPGRVFWSTTLAMARPRA